METELSNCQFAGKGNDFNLTAKKRHVKDTAQTLRTPVRACCSRNIRFDCPQVETKERMYGHFPFLTILHRKHSHPKKGIRRRKNIRQRKHIYYYHKCYQQTESSDLVVLMADNEEQERTTSYKLFLKVISKRRTWVCLFLAVYAILLSSSWNSLNSIVDWYGENHRTSSGWPAVYASVLLGAVFGVLSMAAALFIAVPAIVVIWISVVVSMAFAGKSRRRVVVEGRKVTKEIAGFVFRVLLKEGNVVALLCALLAYFVFFNSYSISS
ncbi:hypothetical protein HA466_0125020 [Hirschfeldia incana]|nr:hypothetical protein HA466_0125020 [Hirschfeldia incana]